MQSTTTTTTTGWFSLLRGVGAVLVTAALLFAAGCDSNDSGMNGNGNGNGNGDGGSSTTENVNYDTTSISGGPDEIIVSDAAEGRGISYLDADSNVVNDVTWSSDFIYKLDNFVFVNEGETLNIEPGTVVQGLPGSGENASALIVARGGQINADGERDDGSIDPIIFTAEGDEGEGLGRGIRGQWGGVILLGDAPINPEPSVKSIEGIPTSETRAQYGAENGDFNTQHNIGTFRYVSIRHTGTTLGSGSEIQGLTLGGVGNQSTVEYVESYASDDDGFEFFGGTVNTKYLIAAWAADDAFDMDEGWQGSNQFWLAVQATDAAGRISEMDGGTTPETDQPYATVKVANATYIGIGPGVEGTQGDGNEPYLIHRDNNATSYYNTVFMDARFTGKGLQIEDKPSGSGADSRDRWRDDTEEGRVLRHENNLWWNVGANYVDPSASDGTTFEDIIQLTGDGDGGTDFRGNLATYLRDKNNQLLSQSPIESMDRSSNGVINQFNPRAVGPADDSPPAPSVFGDVGGVNSNYESVDYYGAFGSENWASGWTLLSQNGTLQ
ncbi:hypothetical protein [Salinibacter altiplanensis]|uniref:hypothetical protein n=1 Tax=Salinibacter altiplanensis TaxID=1803181 RepID=UPI001E47ADD8|nr:hypothetical protein [Salinibacter altiplanensis]